MASQIILFERVYPYICCPYKNDLNPEIPFDHFIIN